MEKKGALTKGLAITGTVLVWFPIVFPILISVVLFLQERIFRFDYLMPAELGPFVFGGGTLLLVAAILAHARRGIIGWGLGIAFVMVVGGQALAVVTGLASGETEPVGWPWMLVLGSLIAYILAVIDVGVGGVMLLRELFKPRQLALKN